LLRPSLTEWLIVCIEISDTQHTPKYYSVICNTEITSICAAHPWLRDEKNAIPLDILIYKLVKSYVRASPLKRAALKVVTYYATISTMRLLSDNGRRVMFSFSLYQCRLSQKHCQMMILPTLEHNLASWNLEMVLFRWRISEL
jgi:hypothetical protein